MNDDGGDDDEDVANQLTVELRLPIQAKRLLRFLLIPPEQAIVEPIRQFAAAAVLALPCVRRVAGKQARYSKIGDKNHSAALHKCAFEVDLVPVRLGPKTLAYSHAPFYFCFKKPLSSRLPAPVPACFFFVVVAMLGAWGSWLWVVLWWGAGGGLEMGN